MDSKEIADRIRAAARLLPLGATVRIRGSVPISSFNVAEWCARIVEHAACERNLIPRLTDEPIAPEHRPRADEAPDRACEREVTRLERFPAIQCGGECGFILAGIGLQCLEYGACGRYLHPGDPGYEEVAAHYSLENAACERNLENPT